MSATTSSTEAQLADRLVAVDRGDGLLNQAGPRVMEPLLADPVSFQERFFAAFRRRNYLGSEDVFGPSLMRVRPPSADKDAVIAVLGPGVPTALSTEAGFVVLTSGPGAAQEVTLNVPFDEFVRAADGTLTWIDDGTALTPAYEADAWQALVAAARPTAVKDFGDRPDLLRDREPGDGAAAEGAPGEAEEARDEFGLTERECTAAGRAEGLPSPAPAMRWARRSPHPRAASSALATRSVRRSGSSSTA